MPALDNAAVGKQVEGALLNLSQAPEAIEIAMYGMPYVLEDDRAIRAALADVTVGECQ